MLFQPSASSSLSVMAATTQAMSEHSLNQSGGNNNSSVASGAVFM
jgi:hypothetical protein